jgi:hypothetical protein
MTNGEGLRRRLDLIERQPDNVPVAKRVAFAQHHFARKSELVDNPDTPSATA